MYFCYFRFSIIVAFTTWYLVQCASLFQGFRRPSSAASWNMGSEIEEPPRSAPQDGDNHFGWKQTAEDRALWRATIKAAAETFVEERKLHGSQGNQTPEKKAAHLTTRDTRPSLHLAVLHQDLQIPGWITYPSQSVWSQQPDSFPVIFRYEESSRHHSIFK